MLGNVNKKAWGSEKFEFPAQPLSLSKTWGTAFRLFKNTLEKVWYIPAIFYGILFMLGLWGGNDTHFVSSLHHFIHFISNQSIPLPVILLLIVAGLTSFVIVYMLILFVKAVIMHRMYNLTTDKPTIGLWQSCKKVFHKLPNLIVAELILLALLSVGALCVFIPYLFWHTQSGLEYKNTPHLFIAIMFIIGMLWIIAWSIFRLFAIIFIPLILFDNQNSWEAIKSSCSLVRKRWWRTFLCFIVPPIYYMVILMLILIPIFLLASLLHSIAGDFTWVPGIIKSGTAIVKLFIRILLLLYLYSLQLILFNDYKIRHELESVIGDASSK